MPPLSRLIGKGVALGAEYKEHRKEVKLSRESSAQSVEQGDTGSSSSQHPSRNTSASEPQDAPPAYSEVAPQTGDRLVASGRPIADDKKAAYGQYDEDEGESSDSDDLSTEDDEADWELDEALDRADSPPTPPEYREVDDLVRDVVTTNNADDSTGLPSNFNPTPLPCPVIIPQRRPRKKVRGFIRAYPPLLSECSGISQAAFLAFLENFHQASQASSIWPIIQISAGIAGLAPSVVAMAVTNAVQIAAQAGQEVQTRSRTNGFLERVNEELFKPRGLFAMIVKYQTSEKVARSENSLLRRLGVGAAHVDFDTGKAIAKYDRSYSGGEGGEGKGKSMSERMQNLRLASGTTRGAIELPEAAPLVFPDVDKAVAKEGPETFKDKARDAKVFLGEYLDRRAQMEYSRQDPTSSLAVPEDRRQMKSQYSDPNHPMYNYGLVGLVSGGHLGRQSRERRRSRSPMQQYPQNPADPAYGHAVASVYDSSRLYTPEDLSHRDSRRYHKRERRALRTEQRMAEGRRVGRKRERRYEDFVNERERVYGGDAGVGRGGMVGRRGGRGPIGMLVGAAGSAIGGGRGGEQGVHGRGAAADGSYGASAGASGSSGPAASYATDGPSNPPAPYGAGRPQRRRRRQRGQGGGPIGMVKRVMREDVLYLMIVNMPSEAELAAAREAIAEAKRK